MKGIPYTVLTILNKYPSITGFTLKKGFGTILFIYLTVFIIMIGHLWMEQIHNEDTVSREKRDTGTGYYRVSKTLRGVVSPKSPYLLEEHFLTLFTTFNASMEKFHIYNNTLQGWLLMKPKVFLVLFTDDDKLSEYVKSIGWDMTLNFGLKACNDTPVLRDMYFQVQKRVNSKFFAYANADILFNRGLIGTLESLVSFPELYNKPFLITGKRSDLILDSFNLVNIRGDREINSAFRKSNISYGYAEDYFVVSDKFPWEIYPNLVIGRPFFDNYLTLTARKNNVTVIDGSATIGALHQKTEGRKRKLILCNKIILGKLWTKKHKNRGNVECFPWESRFDFDGSVFFMKRGSFTTPC